MKSKCLRMCVLSVAAAGIGVLMSGCVVEPDGRVVFRPVVYVAPQPVYVAPAPVVLEEPVMVPDTYVWDGDEFVGVVGDQYFYLGPGDVWLVCEPFRLERFHGWERGHADWREHAIRNDRFRKDARGHVQPVGHGGPPKSAPRKNDEKGGR
jgi:hypothetical protein